MKRIIIAAMAALMATGMVAAAGTFTVAYMTPALSIPFWKDVADGIAQEAAKAKNVKIVNSDSRLSAETQLKNAQDLITSGVNLIVISPTDSASCPAILDLAKKSKVPVVICDIGTDSGDYDAFIISDNYGGAAAAGKYLVEALKAKKVLSGEISIITISLARQNGRDRTEGFKSALAGTPYAFNGLLECKDYSRAESMRFAQDLITAHPKMVGFFTEHDEANLGSIPAFETSGAIKTVTHVGFDGSPEAVQAIKDGKLAAASMQQPVLMGRYAFQAALKILNGQKPADKKVVVPTILVTKENVAKVEPTLRDTVYPNELKK